MTISGTSTARRLRTCLRYTASPYRGRATRRRRWELRLIRWMTSNSSSERPEPTATQVSGDSVSCAGIWHSSRRRWSIPWSSAPPPASVIPRSMMSPASSGGVRSSVSLTAAMIWLTGSSSAARISVRGEHDRLRQPGDHVAAADLGGELLRSGAAEPISSFTSSAVCWPISELVLVLAVVDHRLVHLVAADPDRLGDDDPAERDHRHLAGPAADVEDHAPGRLGDREPGADRSRHRLLDQVGLPGSRRQAGLLDRALLDPGDAGGDADDDPRMREAVLVHPLDEVAQHLLGDVEVGDHAVLERPDRLDRPRGPAEHPLRVDADRVDLTGRRVDRDHRRLREHDAAASDIDERVRGPEVDRHVAAPEAGQIAKKAHS